MSSFCLPTTNTFHRFFLIFFRSAILFTVFLGHQLTNDSRKFYSPFLYLMSFKMDFYYAMSYRWGSGQKCPFHPFYWKKFNMTSIIVEKYDVMEGSVFSFKIMARTGSKKKIKQTCPSSMRYIFASDRNGESKGNGKQKYGAICVVCKMWLLIYDCYEMFNIFCGCVISLAFSCRCLALFCCLLFHMLGLCIIVLIHFALNNNYYSL